MARACYRCKGSGKVFKKGRFTAEDKFWGRNEESCPVCYGSGQDPNWRSKQCSNCWNTIDYRADWDKVPDLCPSCREQKKREREAAKAKWREKSCKGFDGYCGNTIKYNVDWNKIPDLCPSCIAKAKAKREADKAKWREKPCAGGCGTTIKYNTDWEHPPNYCKSCKEKQQREKESRLYVKPDGKNYRIENSRRETLATMGRCTMPPGNKTGPNADKQREYARNGYWWLALDGTPHLSYIFREKPVHDGKFLSLTKSVETRGPTWFRNLVTSYAVATLSESW